MGGLHQVKGKIIKTTVTLRVTVFYYKILTENSDNSDVKQIQTTF